VARSLFCRRGRERRRRTLVGRRRAFAFLRCRRGDWCVGDGAGPAAAGGAVGFGGSRGDFVFDCLVAAGAGAGVGGGCLGLLGGEGLRAFLDGGGCGAGWASAAASC
jgi:hypothetical protein